MITPAQRRWLGRIVDEDGIRVVGFNGGLRHHASQRILSHMMTRGLITITDKYRITDRGLEELAKQPKRGRPFRAARKNK